MLAGNNFRQFLASFASSKFQRLWDAQDEVLSNYLERHAPNFLTNEIPTKDLAIELPTGAGKTLITLLIGEAWRQEGKKVAILSANKTLARQMEQEANELGIPIVLFEGQSRNIVGRDKRAYHRSESIGVMNYWVYFNQNPAVDPADLLIMDDAHLAEHSLQSLYSVLVSRSYHGDLFFALMERIQSRFPYYSVVTDAISGERPLVTSPELMSFIDQIDISDIFRETMDTYVDDYDELRFSWGRMRSNFDESNIYLAFDEIWIRPYIYPLTRNDYYSDTTQRLYMSATIGNSEDLCRRLGVHELTMMDIPSEYVTNTTGRRLVVMNRESELDDDEDTFSAVLKTALDVKPKCLWLCNSHREIQHFTTILKSWLPDNGFSSHPIWELTSHGDEIDEFKNATEGHLMVAGRYDGMDFDEEECRLVVVSSFPNAVNLQEDFLTKYIRDASFIRLRQNQRIVQALGRCNRSEHDYGLYILADRRFLSYYGHESNLESITPNIIAELDFAQDLADEPLEEIKELVTRFLSGDFETYDKMYSNYKENVPVIPAQNNSPQIVEHEVKGWADLFDSHNYSSAGRKFERCWDLCVADSLREITALQGYFHAKSLYLQSRQQDDTAYRNAVQKLFESIDKGGETAWFNRLRTSANRLTSNEQSFDRYEDTSAIFHRFDEYLSQYGKRLSRKVDQISDKLNATTHDKLCEGLADLGTFLGYEASRPKYDGASDYVWRGIFGNRKEMVTLEVKIEHDVGNSISYRDVTQALGQVNHAKSQYGNYGFNIRGIIVTHLEEFEDSALTALGDIKIVNQSAILMLWDELRTLLIDFANSWNSHLHPEERERIFAQLHSKLPEYGWLIRALDLDAQILDSAMLLSEWGN